MRRLWLAFWEETVEGGTNTTYQLMQLSKSRVDHWLLFWDELFPKIALLCGTFALVFTAASMFTEGHNISRLFTWLLGTVGAITVLAAAGYAAIVGLDIYFQRRNGNWFTAVAGLFMGIFFGLFFSFLAVAGLLAVSGS